MPDTSGLVNTTILNTIFGEVENKTPDYAKYITTPGFNKSTAENFVARLKQANLATKIGFHNTLTSFNTKTISNKTKYLEDQKKLNSLIIKDYIFSLRRIYYTSNDRSQNRFVY